MCIRDRSSTAILMLASGLAQAAPPHDTFVHAEDQIQSTAACLVSATQKNATQDCLCAVGNGAFSFCGGGTGGGMIVHSHFAAAWAADMQSAETPLSASIAQTTPPGYLLLDARASCTLDQVSLDLALSPGVDKSKLKGVIGAKAQYSAIYMYPTLGGQPITGFNPERLCAYGQASVIATGSLTQGRGHQWHEGGDSHTTVLNAALQATDIGMTGAFQWAIPGSLLTDPTSTLVGVKFVLVAGVADAVVKAGHGISAVGVLANTKITDRSLLITPKPLLEVLDQKI